jgi:hypothetical protein
MDIMDHRWNAAALAVCLLTLAPLAVAEGPVYVRKTAPFADSTQIAQNIIDECGLPESQMKVLHEQAKELHVEIVADEAAVDANKGRVLLLETVSAISGGNAFVGHRKQVVVKGRLLDNGEEIGNFSALRGSMGGMWGGYKSSCSVLYRCQTTLATDILTWLASPTKDARLGE